MQAPEIRAPSLGFESSHSDSDSDSDLETGGGGQWFTVEFYELRTFWGTATEEAKYILISFIYFVDYANEIDKVFE